MRTFVNDIVPRPATLMIWTLPVTAAALSLSSPAWATNFTWNTGDGIFVASSSWAQSGPVDPDGVPDADDTVIFNRGNVSPYTVSYVSEFPLLFPRHETVDRLEIGTNTLTFAGFSDPLLGDSSLTIDSTVPTATGRGMIIGQTGTDVAVLNSSLPGGISTVYATLGSAAGSSGTLNVNSSAFNVTGTAAATELIVGFSGTGTINVGNVGSVNVAGDTTLGENAGSTGTVSVSGPGSLWNSSGDLSVGGAGIGTLNITNVGVVQNIDGLINGGFNSFSTVTVDGMGSRWTSTGDFIVGRAGSGRLRITNCGFVQNSGGVLTFSYIGRFPDSVGEVLVGSDSTWTNRDLFVGGSGMGTLTIEEGGNVSSILSGAIGLNTGSTGTATVSGAGSKWTIGSFLSVGSSGMGTLAIEAGGSVSNTSGLIGAGEGSTGMVAVTGSGSTWTNSNELRVGSFGMGTLTIEDGGRVFNTSGFIGGGAGSNGTVTVTGGGSKWTNSSELHVGDSGIGELSILGGAAVSNSIGFIGALAGSTGTATVTGMGSTWTNSGDLFVGGQGNGTLNLADSGAVEAMNVFVGTLGEIHGDGTIVGNVENAGLVSPGASAGALSVDSDYTQTTNGELLIELSSATSFDQLNVIDNATLAGTLDVDLINGFTPLAGQAFTILTADDVDGQFEMELLPTVPNLSFDVVYNAQSVVLFVRLSGDYNENGVVDAADYVVWRETLGSTMNLAADGNGNGMIDNGDYNVWRTNFGATAAAAAAHAPASTLVPEPSSLMLLVVGLMLQLLARPTTRLSRNA